MVKLIETVYNFLWGDLLTAPLPGGGTLPLSLLVILLIPTGVYFTIRTKFLPIRLFKDMVGALFEKKDEEQSALSVIQTLIVSTATRVGMGNLVGVVAAISAGGAGAVFWMWVTALIGSSTAFIEATLSQIYKEKDPLYGGYRGGPAYYIHRYFEEKSGKKKRYAGGAADGREPQRGQRDGDRAAHRAHRALPQVLPHQPRVRGKPAGRPAPGVRVFVLAKLA